jgi:hypothetical protein
MQIAHLRLQRQNGFTLDARDHAEDAMRAGVMWPQIDHNAFRRHFKAIGIGRRLAHRHIGDRLLPTGRVPTGGIGLVATPRQFILVPLIFATRMAAAEGLAFFFKIGFLPILAHGMAVEAFPHQHAAQIGMPAKFDAIEVIDLALLQVCARIDRSC